MTGVFLHSSDGDHGCNGGTYHASSCGDHSSSTNHCSPSTGDSGGGCDSGGGGGGDSGGGGGGDCGGCD